MIKHIVYLPFKKELSDDQCLLIMQGLGALKSVIPQIHTFSCGTNTSPEGMSRGYHFGFVMEFLREDDRDIYLTHPAHVEYAQQQILPNLVDGINSPLVFDMNS